MADAIGTTSCPECGTKVPLFVQKNGQVYYTCHYRNPRGEFCRHHERWSLGYSRELIEQARKAESHGNGEQRAEDNRGSRGDLAGATGTETAGGGREPDTDEYY